MNADSMDNLEPDQLAWFAAHKLAGTEPVCKHLTLNPGDFRTGDTPETVSERLWQRYMDTCDAAGMLERRPAVH